MRLSTTTCKVTIILALFVPPGLFSAEPILTPDPNSSFAQRKQWLFSPDWNWAPYPVTAWHPLMGYYALTDFQKFAPGTKQSSNAVAALINVLALAPANQLDGSQFLPLAPVRAIYQFRDRFTPDQLAQIASGAQRFYGYGGGGTENHSLMRLSNAYLLAQAFPSGQWTEGRSGSGTVDSAALMAVAKARLIIEGKLRYERGYYEIGSPNYSIVHLAPLLNLYDFALDLEVKGVAEAMILQLLAYHAANSYRGYQLDSYHRFGGPVLTNGGVGPGNYSPGVPYGAAQLQPLLNWLYWNQCLPDSSRFSTFGDNVKLVFGALSSYEPPVALDHIANLSSDTPGMAHWTLSTEPAWLAFGSDPGNWIPGVERRKVWRDRGYAMSSMNGDHVLASVYLQSGGKFSIAYRTDDRLNYIQAAHPYVQSDEAGLGRWYSLYSPFMQVAQNTSTAIVMFNIPAADPWPDSSPQRPDFYQTIRSTGQIRRSEHYRSLRLDCSFRYPLTIDESAEVTNADGTMWYFLREGNTYIGIRTLTPPVAQQTDTFWRYITVNAVPHGERSQTGLIFEVGTSAAAGGRFPAFSDFQAALVTGHPSVTWGSDSTPSLEVQYTGAGGATLRARYDTNLSPDETGKVHLMPGVWINDKAEISDSWPLLRSSLDDQHPMVTLENSLLTITDPISGIVKTVDWSDPSPGSIPRIQPIARSGRESYRGRRRN